MNEEQKINELIEDEKETSLEATSELDFEETTQKREWRKKIPILPICIFTAGAFAIGVQVIILFLLFLGAVNLYGERITFITVFDFIFELSFSSGRTQRSLIGCALALVYILIAVLMAIRIWNSGKSYFEMLSIWQKQRQLKGYLAARACTYSLVEFFYLCLFAALVCMAGGAFDRDMLLSAAVLAGLVFLTRGMLLYNQNVGTFAWIDFLTDICKDVFTYLCFMFLAAFLLGKETIPEMIEGLRFLFQGNLIVFSNIRGSLYSLYIGLIEPILISVLTIFFLKALFAFLRDYERGIHVPFNLRRTLILFLIMAASKIIFDCIAGGGAVNGLTVMQLMSEELKKSLPILLLIAVSMGLLSKFKNRRFYR